MKKYFSLDIEASGPVPATYSMLSLGVCIVGEINKQFYRELKPLNKNFNLEAMKISCLGLKCLKEYAELECNKKYLDPNSKDFNPIFVLNILEKEGVFPADAMKELNQWISNNSKGFTPVIAAAPVIFDGSFTSWYFHNFLGSNPFGHSGEDINSMYRGYKKNINASIQDLNLRKGNLTHNALEDSIQQAKEFEEVLKLIKGEPDVVF